MHNLASLLYLYISPSNNTTTNTAITYWIRNLKKELDVNADKVSRCMETYYLDYRTSIDGSTKREGPVKLLPQYEKATELAEKLAFPMKLVRHVVVLCYAPDLFFQRTT